MLVLPVKHGCGATAVYSTAQVYTTATALPTQLPTLHATANQAPDGMGTCISAFLNVTGAHPIRKVSGMNLILATAKMAPFGTTRYKFARSTAPYCPRLVL